MQVPTSADPTLVTYNGAYYYPLAESSWSKFQNPIFQRNDAAGVFGPGHHSFFTSPDGTEPGAEVRQWTCNGQAVQQWDLS